MDITSGLLSRDEYLRAITSAVELPALAGVRDVLVSYGFGCDCPDEQLYEEIPMPVDRLPEFVAESEAADYYRVGRDNLHLTTPGGGTEFLFCHESDVHFISDDAELVGRLKAEWSSWGWPDVVVHPGSEDQPAMGDARSGA